MTSYTWNFQNFTSVFTILVKFDIYFLRLPWEIVFGVITDKKKIKKNSVLFKLFRYKVFVHWKLKLLNFLIDSILTSVDNMYYLAWLFGLVVQTSDSAIQRMNHNLVDLRETSNYVFLSIALSTFWTTGARCNVSLTLGWTPLCRC